METNYLQERRKMPFFTRGNVVVLVGCLLATIAAFFFLLRHGGIMTLSVSEIVNTLLHRNSGTVENQVFREIRLPLTMNVLLYGAAMGAASVLLQRAIRFRVICPSTLGLVPTGIVTMLLALHFFGIQNEWVAMLIGVLGASIGLLAAYVFSLAIPIKTRGMRYLVGGLVLTAIFEIVLFILSLESSQEAIFMFQLQIGLFRTGSQLIPISLLCILLTLCLSGRMNGSSISDPVWLTTVCIVLAIVLTGSAIATIGDWAVIGLISSNLARWLVRKEDYRVILPAAAMIGAVMVTLLSVIPWLINYPSDIRFYYLISGIGVPFLAFLIWKEVVRSSKLAKPDQAS